MLSTISISFLIPPDAATSFAERADCSACRVPPWSDYDSRLISPGGGVYAREAKSIDGSKVKAMLGLKSDRVAPNDSMIRAMLTAPVDLLWNGGIGTYVKASTETHEQARDKANDGLRVDATELRCRVVGEVATSGSPTRPCRVCAAWRAHLHRCDRQLCRCGLFGSRVNIKILLDKLVAGGDLTTNSAICCCPT